MEIFTSSGGQKVELGGLKCGLETKNILRTCKGGFYKLYEDSSTVKGSFMDEIVLQR